MIFLVFFSKASYRTQNHQSTIIYRQSRYYLALFWKGTRGAFAILRRHSFKLERSFVHYFIRLPFPGEKDGVWHSLYVSHSGFALSLSLSLHHFIIAFVNCDAQKTTLLMDIFLKVDVIKFIGKKNTQPIFKMWAGKKSTRLKSGRQKTCCGWKYVRRCRSRWWRHGAFRWHDICEGSWADWPA